MVFLACIRSLYWTFLNQEEGRMATMAEHKRATYTLPHPETTVIPQVTITAHFLTGSVDNGPETVQHSLTIQDVTASTAHAGTTTRLLHIMFEGEDIEKHLAVLQGMATDFREFYNQLRHAHGPDGSNPLALPAINPNG